MGAVRQSGKPMRRTGTTSALAALVGAAVLAAPSAVAADRTIGEDVVPTAPCSDGYTLFQSMSPASSYAAPTDGVITSWSTRGGASRTSTRTFKLGRTTGGSLSVVASGTPITVPAGQRVTQEIRVPARAGDFLGFFHAGGQNQAECATLVDTTYEYTYAPSDLQPGPAPSSVQTAGVRLTITAVLEPDADRDGYGDTTQDSCPSQADTQGACRDRTAPQTRITSARAARLKGTARKAKVTVAFAANEPASYRCSVDGSAYRRCTSPLVRKLAKGKHTVAVRAGDAAGNTDATPAVARVRVKRR